jgi:hypothetical protein
MYNDLMKTATKPNTRWTEGDRQAFADRNILRATKIPNKKRVAAREACRGKRWAE